MYKLVKVLCTVLKSKLTTTMATVLIRIPVLDEASYTSESAWGPQFVFTLIPLNIEIVYNRNYSIIVIHMYSSNQHV